MSCYIKSSSSSAAYDIAYLFDPVLIEVDLAE